MDIKELLKFVDESMFAKTGKRLNDLQRLVIEGALNGQKYIDIADNFDRSEGHVKDVGYELLQMLSDIFEEPVSKVNLKSVLERQRNVNVSFDQSNINSNVISCVNFNSNQPKSQSDKIPLEETDTQRNKQISKIKKLREAGFTDDAISELLEISLEFVKSPNLGESA
ncbi:MAG: hypothetical protein WCP16_08770 [Pseudanabaena sp. ELA645]|jgi:hypothetical protein